MEKKGTSLLRIQNERKVLSILRQNKNHSRQDIAIEMGVSKNTVSLIVDDLISRSLVREVGVATSNLKGRPKKLIELHPDGFKSIGFAIEKDSLEYVVLNYAENTLEKSNIKIDTSNYKIVIDRILSIVNKLMESFSNILGIGISIPGVVNSYELIVYKSIRLGWENVSFKKLNSYVDVPIYLQNNVNMSALTNIKRSDYDMEKSFFYIRSEVGVGGAYIINKKILNGVSWTAGEIGHISVDLNGPACFCGQNGCLEKFISFNNFRKTLGITDYSNDDVIRLLKSPETDSNEEIKNVLSNFGNYMARAIVTIIHLINPGEIIIDTAYTHSKSFITSLSEIINKNTMNTPLKNTNVHFIQSEYNDCHGSALYAILSFEEAHQT